MSVIFEPEGTCPISWDIIEDEWNYLAIDRDGIFLSKFPPDYDFGRVKPTPFKMTDGPMDELIFEGLTEIKQDQEPKLWKRPGVQEPPLDDEERLERIDEVLNKAIEELKSLL